MKLVVGLGNPGPRYASTRHNAGFRIADRFAASQRIALASRRFGGRFGHGQVAAPGSAPLEVGVLEPGTFMNLSGDPVALAVRELAVEEVSRDLLVLLDDADLPFGRLRLRSGGGSGGHRGLAHVLDRLGRRDVPRLRFGVGRPPPGVETADYALEPFSAEEELALPARVAEAAEAVLAALTCGLEVAMNRYNRDPDA